MGIFFLSLNDMGNGYKALKRSDKLFEEIKKAYISKDAKLLAVTEGDKFPEYPHFLNTEEFVSTVVLPIVGVKPLVDELLVPVEGVNSETFDTCNDPCWSSRTASLTSIVSKLFDLVPLSEGSLVAADSHRLYICLHLGATRTQRRRMMMTKNMGGIVGVTNQNWTHCIFCRQTRSTAI